MPEYRNTKRTPVAVDLPGRAVSVPGRSTLVVSQAEDDCENLRRVVAKGLLRKVPEKAPTSPVSAPAAPLAPEPSFPAPSKSPSVEEEELSLDSPGQPTGSKVAPSDDQAPKEGSSDEPGEGATKPKSRGRKRKKKPL
jgi:hypothetical protein